MIDEILKYNKEFVEEKKYEQYKTSKYQTKKITTLIIADTRLTELFLKVSWDQEWRCEDHQKNTVLGSIKMPSRSGTKSVLIGIFETWD